MIRLAVQTEAGRSLMMIGLTATNIDRMLDSQPVYATTADMEPVKGPEPGEHLAFNEVCVFFADHDTCVQLAESLGIDAADLLAQVGETSEPGT